MPTPSGESIVRELEQAISSIRGVRTARVDGSPSRITAVRILVLPEKPSDETIAEVVSLASSRFGITIEPSVVDVLRSSDASDATAQPRRRKLSSLSTERVAGHFTTRVMLELGGDVLVGEEDLPLGAPIEYRTVAGAVLRGLKELMDTPVHIDAVDLLEVGGSRFAVVAIKAGSEMLVGSAVAGHDDHAAIARATLDALNRTIERSDSPAELG